MPLFNWGADEISAIATPHAWIYLAVALPLTITVVALWLVWIRWTRLLRQRDDRGEVPESASYAGTNEMKTACYV